MSNVHHLQGAGAGVEGFIDRKTLAAHIGYSVTTIDRMVAMGMPSRKWGRTRRFKLSEAQRWLDQVGPSVGSWRDAA